MDTPHIPIALQATFPNVYEPAEDSFLLLDALEKDLPGQSFFQSDDNPPLVLEVCCGSGIVATALANFSPLAKIIPLVFTVDVNPDACFMTAKVAAHNCAQFKVESVVGNGVSLSTLFRTPFDIIVCNPPYVPVVEGEHDEDKLSGTLEKSWSGGVDGNSFITPFLESVASALSSSGVLYLLLSSWNRPEDLVKQMYKHCGLKGHRIIYRKTGPEHLTVWRFSRP